MMLMAMRGIKECIRVRLSRRLHSFSSYRLLLVLFKYPAAVQVQDFFLLFFVVFGATVCKRWKMLKSLRSPLLMMINVFSSAFSSSFTFAALAVVRRGWDSVFIERSSVDNFLLKFFLSLFVFTFFLIRSTLFYWSFIYYLFYPFFTSLTKSSLVFIAFFHKLTRRKKHLSNSSDTVKRARRPNNKIISWEESWNSCMIHTHKRVATLSKSEPANATIKKKNTTSTSTTMTMTDEEEWRNKKRKSWKKNTEWKSILCSICARQWTKQHVIISYSSKI